MVIQINIGDHVSPRAGWVPIPNNRLSQVRFARTQAQAVARGWPSANVFFRRLRGGRTLTELLDDSSIWINFDPALVDFGISNTTFGELAIGTPAFRIGRWTVLATLIHELAHLNGAGDDPDTRAEEALLHCGLGKKSEQRTGVDDPRTPYNPRTKG